MYNMNIYTFLLTDFQYNSYYKPKQNKHRDTVDYSISNVNTV